MIISKRQWRNSHSPRAPADIEAGEIRRQRRVSEDKFGYLFLFALQLLPLIGTDRALSILYCFGVAVTTVYVYLRGTAGGHR